jgi:geranylgeranyl reductase family protein
LFVVGAGPAGAAAALSLALAGCRRVTLLEKSAWPRAKACAGGLGPRTLPWLRRFGIYDAVAARGVRSSGLLFTGPRGRTALLSGPGLSGFVLPRDDFDRLLVERALTAGVTFIPETRVKAVRVGETGVLLETDQGELDGEAVIVATGALPSVAHLAQPERTRAPAIMARYQGLAKDEHHIEMVFAKELLPYYAWLFPEPDGHANVGLMRPPGQDDPSLHALLDEVIARHFGDRLRHADQIGRRVGAPLCFADEIESLARPRLLLTGEAAGLVNSLSGEGIPHALESGAIAGATLAWALERGALGEALVERYQRQIRRRFAWRLWVARMGRRMFRSRFFPPFADAISWPGVRYFSGQVLAWF